MQWTKEAVEVLKELALEGRSASKIAAALGSASRSAVIGKANRIGIQLNGGRGGSVVITSSLAAIYANANTAHYSAAKAGLVMLMKVLAKELAPQSIRVNSIHPTTVATDMILNEPTYRLFRPDLEHPGRDDFVPASQEMNLLPIPWVEPVDISNALLFLASDEARYITGVALPVDAGCLLK